MSENTHYRLIYSLGSPMDYHLTNLLRCVAVGEGLKTAGVNKTAFFTVETKDVGDADCNVDITGLTLLP